MLNRGLVAINELGLLTLKQLIHAETLKIVYKALAKRLDFSLDFLLNKKSRQKSSRLATLLSKLSGVK